MKIYPYTKKFNASETQLRFAVVAAPEDPEAYYRLAIFLYDQNSFLEAKAETEMTSNLKRAYQDASQLWLDITYQLNKKEKEQEQTLNKSLE